MFDLGWSLRRNSMVVTQTILTRWPFMKLDHFKRVDHFDHLDWLDLGKPVGPM